LIDLLREIKEAIGRTLWDIEGISPSIVQHIIHLEENTKPYRDHERGLNPTLQEVVNKEVLKWLDYGIICLIADSEWVNPVQIVSKKIGITVVRSDKNELVPTRVQSRWLVCVDYRKLNAVTRKDHFLLSFRDQMLERLAKLLFRWIFWLYSDLYNSSRSREDYFQLPFWYLCL